MKNKRFICGCRSTADSGKCPNLKGHGLFKLDPAHELEQIRRGELIAETLQVRKDKDGRYKTEWGTKTPLGLFQTVKRLIEEGQ